MTNWLCNCCGEIDTKLQSLDNSICDECGSVDDFTEVEL